MQMRVVALLPQLAMHHQSVGTLLMQMSNLALLPQTAKHHQNSLMLALKISFLKMQELFWQSNWLSFCHKPMHHQS
eukprot:1961628-Karenia_brevis.AAC.1